MMKNEKVPEINAWMDYHLHSSFSCDSQATMEEMCRAAISGGLSEIGFTEHFDLIPQDPCFAYFKAAAWWENLLQCREMFEDQLIIKAGIEIGEPHRFPDEVDTLIGEFKWDFILGSLHWVDDQLIFDKEYYSQAPEEAYRRYFHELLVMVQDGRCDILAHVDIIKRYGFDFYGPFKPEVYEPEIRSVLRACAHSGIALEINTSTLRRPVGQTSPDKRIVAWYLEEGGRAITLGSDAHDPRTVAYGLEGIMRWLPELGVEHLASFTARQAQLIDLQDGRRS
jgi:histidinol-phosphatase (PHP family)